jgi:hypothetical protein
MKICFTIQELESGRLPGTLPTGPGLAFLPSFVSTFQKITQHLSPFILFFCGAGAILQTLLFTNRLFCYAVDPHWFQFGSRSGSREPNQCGSDPGQTCRHKKAEFLQESYTS